MMTAQQLALVREADQILAAAGLNKVAQPRNPRRKKGEDAMVKAIRTPCGGQPRRRR